MQQRHRLSSIFAIAIALLVLPMASVQAQNGQDVVITVTNVSDNVYMLVGQGGNIGLSVGADGPLIIDDQFDRLTEKILAAVATVSDRPVQFVVNTHHHGDHTGGNANLQKVGAVIVAHDNVRKRMQAAQTANANADPSALPVITFSHDATFHWNEQTTRVHHVEPAHTDGDAIVFFEEANVIHMGDTYFASGYPYMDLGSGGGIDGVIAAADYALGLADASTKIIPGHGPLSTPSDLRVYRDMLTSIRSSIAKAVADGKTLEETLAMKPTASYDAKWGGGFIKADGMVEAVFRSVSK